MSFKSQKSFKDRNKQEKRKSISYLRGSDEEAGSPQQTTKPHFRHYIFGCAEQEKVLKLIWKGPYYIFET